MNKAKVYITGAGPGDPGLITVKAVDALKIADCVIYDYLVNPVILNYVKDGCEIIYAGKQAAKHTFSQDKINALLVKKAKQGKIVVRLKGGDPFIFARGSEEAFALVKAGIKFEIISGVTSAISVPTYAGIPLTDRRFSSTCTFVTGQEDPRKKNSSINWQALAKEGGTLVFLMGVKNLKLIVDSLIENGKAKNTPVAIIRWGTLPKQKTWVSNLKDVVKDARREGILPPSIIVIGDVVRARREFNWFESKPLFGKSILVTRMEEKGNKLSVLLGNEGANVVELATIQVSPLKDYSEFDRKINEFSGYDWLIFTSANGIGYALDRLKKKGKDLRSLKGPRICAIGPSTKEGLERLGLKVEHYPLEFRQEGILKFFKKIGVKDKRILILSAKYARDVLRSGLAAQGARVDNIAVYETLKPKIDFSKLNWEDINCITFASSSAAKNFASLFSKQGLKKILKGKTVASIGPITSSTCKKLGMRVGLEAGQYTFEGLTKAIVNYYK